MQGDDRRRREAEQRAREAAEEKARRAAALQAKLEALTLAREMVQGGAGGSPARGSVLYHGAGPACIGGSLVCTAAVVSTAAGCVWLLWSARSTLQEQCCRRPYGVLPSDCTDAVTLVSAGALGSVQSRAQQRPSCSASQLSFGQAAEAEVMAYLEAAGAGQLRAMRMSTSRSDSLASSRGGSRRSTLQHFVSFAGAQASGRSEASGSTPATAGLLPAGVDIAGRASGDGELPAPARPLTALAADVASQALEQAVFEAAEGEAAPRPLMALAADMASQALEQAVTEVELGEAAMTGTEATAAPGVEGAAEPMDISPAEQGALASEGTLTLEASAAEQAAGASTVAVEEGARQDQAAVESEILPEPGAELLASEMQPIAGSAGS